MLIIGCDSLLDLDGAGHGKPGRQPRPARALAPDARPRGVLHTGHHVILREGDQSAAQSAVASTTVHFARLADAEIAAYVASGEPLQVAGAFTIDGLGGAFVSRIEGDHHNVVGISLPLLRLMLAELGVAWTSLWRPPG